ncbi:MAG: SH3 domain-containing protein [Caldilineaceae bacterium]|nr:SH3 domain-containing protein [Caldilineaceae bacterium]
MDRLFRILILIFVTVLAAAISASPAYAAPGDRASTGELAQIGQLGTPTTAAATATPTVPPQPTQTPPPPPTATSVPTVPPSPTVASSASAAVGITTTAPPTTGAEITVSAGTPVTATEQTPAGPLEGTIIANRSDNNARFFVEGITYDLAAGRSLGLVLPRASSVLNLYNCDAAAPENQATCFWDPYLITLDGFYEIYKAPDPVVEARLLLRQAGTPPTDQVWVQNRSGQTEQIVYKNETFDIAPTTVREFPVASGVPAILYVRSCLTLSGQTVCEWAPKTLDAGVYYAMVAVNTAGGEPNSQITTLDLRPIVAGVEVTPTPEATAAGQDQTAVPAETAAPAPLAGQLTCRLLVPTLNVRSGPGLYYEIIDKVRSGDQPATVVVNGRSVDGEWLTVIPAVTGNGWITASPSFITCDGDLMGLPMVEAPAPPPTPEPAPVAESPAVDASNPESQTVETAPETSAGATPAPPDQPVVPAGQALLVVNNGFQHEMRFTLDQRYRANEGPSEFDLAPGESVAIVVFPGQVDFSASSPWSGLSGNASLHVEADQSLTLWLRFEPDADNSWRLVWQ